MMSRPVTIPSRPRSTCAIWILIAVCVLIAVRGATAQEIFYPSVYWPDAATPDGAEAITLSPGETRDDLEITLADGGGTITGKIVSDLETPLSGVLVVARNGPFLSHSFSDGDGSFTISGVAPGNNILRAWTFDPLSSNRDRMPFYAPATPDSADAEVLLVTAGSAVAAPDLVLPLGARIQGFVLSNAEEGIPGLQVEGEHLESGQLYVTYSRSDGSFLLQGLLSGRYVVVVRGRDSVYLDEYLGETYEREDAEILVLGDAPDIEHGTVRLEEQGRILGKVENENSQVGIPGVEVVATEQNSGFIRTTLTDDAGFYILGKLRPGSYKLHVPAIGKYWLNEPNEDLARIIEVLPGEDILPRDFEGFTVGDCSAAPEALGVITGKIEVDDTEPEGGWTLRAESDSLVRETHVDLSGEYRIKCLTDGDYIVSLTADSVFAKQFYDEVPYESEAMLVNVVKGDSTETIDFFPKPGGRIGGLIRSASAFLPVAGAPIRIRLEETGAVIRTMTDDEGRFLVGTMPDGTGLLEGNYIVSVDSFSTGQIAPTPVVTLQAWVQVIQLDRGWGVRVYTEIPFGEGPFLVELLRRTAAGIEEVVASASPSGTGGGVLALADPAPPVGPAQYKVVATATGRTLESNWLAVEIPAGTSPVSIRSGPNPSPSEWKLSFELPRPDRISIEIYSMDGRLMWTTSKDASAGEHSLTWDGRGTDGRPAAAGIYAYVLRNGSDQRLAWGRLALVR